MLPQTLANRCVNEHAKINDTIFCLQKMPIKVRKLVDEQSLFGLDGIAVVAIVEKQRLLWLRGG